MTSAILIPFMETFIDNTEIYVMHLQQLNEKYINKINQLKKLNPPHKTHQNKFKSTKQSFNCVNIICLHEKVYNNLNDLI